MSNEKNILKFLSEFLPKKLTDIYIPEKILTLNRHNTILLLSSKESEKKFVLKILEKDYYNTILSKTLNTLSDKNLFLPLQTDFDTLYVYQLYPQQRTLSEALLQEGLDYPMLYCLIQEIGNAVTTLHQYNILHLDITPDNIFIDEKNHFYLGDFSSSRLIKKNLFFHSFHKCQYTGTTPSFAPQEKNFKNISFWNDQYSFALLLYLLFNNGNSPNKENIRKHSFFPTANHMVQKAMSPPSKISKEMFSQFLSELKSSLKKDEELFNCKNYQIQLLEPEEAICKSATPDCFVPKENNVKIQTYFSKNQLHVPLPLYVLLICCGFLFLFSLYHYMAQNKKNVSSPMGVYNLQNALIPSPEVIKETDTPCPSNIAKADPSNTPDNSTKTNAGNLKNNPEKALDISNSSYHNNTFLKSSIQPESIQILFANSCQFTNSAAFSDFINLEELYLYNNPLSSVTELSKMKFLKTLVLSKCKLQDISCLAKIKTLTILDLSQNKNLKKIQSLSSLKNLNYLIVTHTNISQEDISFLQNKLPHCTILF